MSTLHNGGRRAQVYSFSGCNSGSLNTTVFQTWGNTFYTPNATFTQSCTPTSYSTLPAWQAAQQDANSTVTDTGSVATIIQLALTVLYP